MHAHKIPLHQSGALTLLFGSGLPQKRCAARHSTAGYSPRRGRASTLPLTPIQGCVFGYRFDVGLKHATHERLGPDRKMDVPSLMSFT